MLFANLLHAGSNIFHTSVDAGYSYACLDVSWSVCESCVSLTVDHYSASYTNTDELIEMPFGRQTCVHGPKEPCIMPSAHLT